jgi:hypothetical protein
MIAPTDWRELARFNDLHQARAIATSVASMEFESRLIDARGNDICVEYELTYDGPFAVQVPAGHWAELRDVIDELIAEQMEFDVRLAAFHDRRCHRQQVLLAFMVALVAVLAMLGVIRL